MPPLTLTTGTRLGPYEILSLLGVGGMGEVYRATDTKLKRQVAIKVLPAALTADHDRLARFQREAEVLASLNHPNIAAIHGLEESDGLKALVMELVEGPTLADRIAQGAIPLDEALPIARQIAEALEAAHEQGIIHRDLKPANIKVRPDGTVKVLDFGLAKAMDPSGASSEHAMNSPTISVHATQAGMILGTAAYMSPEQARGKAADKRADIWSFGIVLFEMLTGRRAFDGDDVSITLASVLKSDPDWTALPATTPVSLRRLLSRCLKKDPKERLQAIGDARIEIDDLLSGRAEPTTAVATILPAVSMWRRTLPWAVASGLGAGLAVVLALWAPWRTAPPAAPVRLVTRFPIALPSTATFTGTNRHVLALSPDGTKLVFVNNLQLWLRALDQNDAKPIPGTDVNPQAPFFSPDGQWIGFWANGQIRKIPISGGSPVKVCDAPSSPYGASWSGDSIYFDAGTAPDGILKVPADGGTPEVVVRPGQKRWELVSAPQLLPGGAALLFGSAPSASDNGDIVVQSLKTGARKTVVSGGVDPRYLDSGHIVYARGGALYAIPFDVGALEPQGGPIALVEQVAVSNPPVYQFAVSISGSLAYMSGAAFTARTLAWVDRQGREQPIGAPTRAYSYPRLSPDGTRLVVASRDQERDIWSWDFTRGTGTRVTFGPGTELYPTWTPDGRKIIFSSNLNLGFYSVYSIAADGTGSPERLTGDAGANQYVNAVSPDGHAAVLYVASSKTGNDLFVASLDGTKPVPVRPLIQTPFNEIAAALSPDGHWLAYQSNESGRNEVYVRPYPNVEQGRWQVSTEGGLSPAWSRDGRELFYLANDGRLMAVPTTVSPSFTFGKPAALFDIRGYSTSEQGRNYDVARDGQRFLVVKNPVGGTSLQMVENWVEEVKAKAPRKH